MTQLVDYALADPAADTRAERLDSGLYELSVSAGRLSPLRQHWAGEQPAAFLSQQAADSLDKRLQRLSVNFPRLAVQSLAERIRLAGIVATRADRPLGDTPASVWKLLTDAGIADKSGIVTTDMLLYGMSYATIWATETGRVTLTADAPTMMVHARDPATDEVEYAVRAWTEWYGGPSGVAEGARAVLYEPDAITFYSQPGSGAPIPGTGWKVTKTLDNPLGVVPVVPFVRRVSGSDPSTGQSIVSQILDLTDAVAKLLSDAMVTSEYEARPRRWATGLEIVEDDDGKPVDPFGVGRFLQSEAPETKFGQLDAAKLDGYVQMIGTITQLIGALTALPPNYLGVVPNQPPSADAVKATEIQLTTAAYTEQSRMEPGWRDVAWLADAVGAGRPADPAARGHYDVVWKSPEIRTQAQAADAAAKLQGIGVPLESLLADPLGYTPADVTAIMAAARTTEQSAQ